MKKMTDAELKEKLGDYIAPQGLYQITKDMPFLGKVSCNIERMEAGTWQEIVIDYELEEGAPFPASRRRLCRSSACASIRRAMNGLFRKR